MSSIKSDNLNSSDTHSKLLKLGTMTTSTGPCATCARLPYGLCSGRCQTRSSTILLRQIYPRILPPRPRSRTHESQSSCSCLRMSRQRASSEWCMRSSGTGLGPDLEQVRAATCLKVLKVRTIQTLAGVIGNCEHPCCWYRTFVHNLVVANK